MHTGVASDLYITLKHAFSHNGTVTVKWYIILHKYTGQNVILTENRRSKKYLKEPKMNIVNKLFLRVINHCSLHLISITGFAI